MRPSPLVSTLLAAAVTVAALPAVALADDPPAAGGEDVKAKAKMHYQNAEQAMKEGRFAAAAAEYGAAYEAIKDPFLFYKIGVAHQSAGKCDAAIVYFKRYLKEGKPPADFDKQVNDRIAQCGGTASAPAGGDATIGTPTDAGTGAGTTDPGTTGAGAPTDTGTSTGVGTTTDTGAPADAGATTDTGTTTDTGATGDGAATGDTAATGDAAPAFLDEKPSWQRSAGWILMGSTVALATAGTILAMSGASREEDLESLADFRDPEGQPATYEGNVQTRYEDLVDEGKRFNTWSTIAFGAAGACLVGSVTLLLLDSRHPSDSGSAISRVRPVIGHGSAGVAATLRF